MWLCARCSWLQRGTRIRLFEAAVDDVQCLIGIGRRQCFAFDLMLAMFSVFKGQGVMQTQESVFFSVAAPWSEIPITRHPKHWYNRHWAMHRVGDVLIQPLSCCNVPRYTLGGLYGCVLAGRWKASSHPEQLGTEQDRAMSRWRLLKWNAGLGDVFFLAVCKIVLSSKRFIRISGQACVQSHTWTVS